MLRLFSKINIISILLLPLFVVAYLFLYANYSIGSYAFDYQSIVNLGFWGVYPLDKSINFLLCGFFILLNAILLTWTFNKRNFVDKTTLLPAFLYVILMTNTREFQQFDGILIFHSLLIAIINILTQLTFNKENYAAIFNMGLLAGLGSTLFPAFYLLMPFLYFVSLFQVAFNWRAMMLYVAGFTTPQLFLLYFFFVKNQPIDSSIILWSIDTGQTPSNYIFDVIILFGIILITIISSQFSFSSLAQNHKKAANGMNLLLIAWTIIAFYMYLWYDSVIFFQLAIVPLAFIATINLLKNQNSFIQLAMFFVAISFSYLKFFFK